MSSASANHERLGLALSGGGFRASFFHIGVLARLAERGLLRRVEVISTVSGGSIVGALYYLYVQQLLEAKPDSEIDDSHYVEIVKRMEDTFLPTVQRNVRALATANLLKNFRMARDDYSRSTRMGELYDELFYRPAWNNPLFGPKPDPQRREPIEMRNLCVFPHGHDGFDPRTENEAREAKVPILLLNATTLNTGHNFRFEAIRLGEPEHDSAAERDVDKNARLGRARYRDDRSVTLGTAVGASACVPSLFHPVPFLDLYAGWEVQLVDGGNHDNQGVQGLVDRTCTHMFVSDASGQMTDQAQPSTRIPAVAMRASNGIYGDRVREEQLIGVLRGGQAGVVHLRHGLRAKEVPPLWPATVSKTESEDGQAPDLSTADFDVHEKVQWSLSRVRTDLDAFSEVEATALELDGYLMTEAELKRQPRVAELASSRAAGVWGFDRREIRALVKDAPEAYVRQLESANARFLRFLKLRGSRRPSPLVTAAGGILKAVLGLGGLGVVLWLLTLVSAPLAIPVGIAIGLLVIVAAYLSPRARWPVVSKAVDVLATRGGPVLLALPLWIAAQLTLHVATPLFLRLGRVERVVSSVPGELQPSARPTS